MEIFLASCTLGVAFNFLQHWEACISDILIACVNGSVQVTNMIKVLNLRIVTSTLPQSSSANKTKGGIHENTKKQQQQAAFPNPKNKSAG